MISALGQAAAEAARSGSMVWWKYLVDGGILIAALKTFEAIASAIKRRRSSRGPSNGSSRPSPPKPGEADVCKEHLGQIKEIRTKVDENAKALSAYMEFRGNTAQRLERIEEKVDDLKDIIIGRERQ